MTDLTEEQFRRIAGLGLLGVDNLELIRLVRIEGLSWADAASRLNMDVPQAERRYADAVERALGHLGTLAESALGAEYRYWHALLDVMRGPGISAPTSPPMVLNRYLSAPGAPVYDAGKLRTKYPNPHDFVKR